MSFELPDIKNEYPCPVIVGTKPVVINDDKDEYSFVGTGIVLNENTISIKCNDSFGNIVFNTEISFREKFE